jgi:hypothetical protein
LVEEQEKHTTIEKKLVQLQSDLENRDRLMHIYCILICRELKHSESELEDLKKETLVLEAREAELLNEIREFKNGINFTYIINLTSRCHRRFRRKTTYQRPKNEANCQQRYSSQTCVLNLFSERRT